MMTIKLQGMLKLKEKSLREKKTEELNGTALAS